MKANEITAETIAEVQPHLEAAVTAMVQLWDALGSIEDMIGVEVEMSDMLFPHDYMWVAVFAVRGGSEGHYVHIEIIHRNASRQLLATYKTFSGRTNAQLIAHRAAILLGA